jgi:DNA-binding response OmpR family regulator
VAARDKTVLVVDDDDALRAYAAKLIETRGYRVLTAGDGHEALAILTGGTAVNLLVLDVVMPGLDGLQTLEEIRKTWSYAQLPVILLTAQSKDEDVLGGYRSGADCYITKPLKPSALLNIVDYLIGDLSPAERAKLEPLL